MPKPQKVECYKTANGLVETLDEWKSAKVLEVFNDLRESDAPSFNLVSNKLREMMVERGDALVEILSIKETGRPKGRGDSKPRKPKETPPTT